MAHPKEIVVPNIILCLRKSFSLCFGNYPNAVKVRIFGIPIIILTKLVFPEIIVSRKT